MRYLLLIYSNEAEDSKYAEEDFNKWMEYTQELREAEVMLAGDALKPTATATTVRLDGEKVLNIDGPFAETKEQLGGFYMIEAKDIDEALKWAAKMPNIPRGGSVEVRPIMEFDI